MGWKGIAFGAWIGSRFGGPLGAVLGAALGHQVEKQFAKPSATTRRRVEDRSDARSAKERSMMFCASAAAMLAKLAKADGCVTQREIVAVEAAFARLGFDAATRDYAIAAFRKAKDDAHTIYEYAAEFSEAIGSVEVRELFYGLLWDIACSDGTATREELEILQRMTVALGIRSRWFDFYAKSHNSERGRCGATGGESDLVAAYATLGVSATASDEEIKAAYRELAKKNHPDLLRSQGLPDEMVVQATERMKRINEAWQIIRNARKQ